MFHVAEKIQNAKVNEEEIVKYLPKIYEQLKDISKEDLIKRFVSEEFNRFLEYYQQAPDLNQKGGAGFSSNGKMSRFFINLGELDGLHWKFLKDYLADISGVIALHIFNVDVKKSFSFFESETKDAQTFLNVNAKELKFNERKVQIEASSGGGERGGRSSSESRGEGGYKRREGGSGGSRSGGGYAGKREGGSAYPRRSSESSSGGGYKRRDSEGGEGFKRRDSSEGGGYKRRESSSEGTGFKRRETGSSEGGGGFKRKESVDGGFKKSFDKPKTGGSRPRTKRSFNE